MLVGAPVFLKGRCRHECFLNRCPSDYNLKPVLFLGKELEDMIHSNVFKVALLHTNFTDTENEKVTLTIFCCTAEVELSVVAFGS